MSRPLTAFETFTMSIGHLVASILLSQDCDNRINKSIKMQKVNEDEFGPWYFNSPSRVILSRKRFDGYSAFVASLLHLSKEV